MRPKEQIILFTDNFKVRLVCESLPKNFSYGHGSFGTLEAAINRADEDLVLGNLSIYYRTPYGSYMPYAEASARSIKIPRVSLIAGPEEKLCSGLKAKGEMDIKLRFDGLNNGLMGRVYVPGNHELEDDIEELIFLNKQFEGKRFIPFYNPQQRQGQTEFLNLFNGTLYDRITPKVVLANVTSDSIFSKSIVSDELLF